MEDIKSSEDIQTVHFHFKEQSQYSYPNIDEEAYQFVYKRLTRLIHEHTDQEFTKIGLEGDIEDVAAYISFYVSIYNQGHQFKIILDLPEDELPEQDVLPDELE